MSDPVVFALSIAFGLALASMLVAIMNYTHRGFRKATRKIKCRLGFHAGSGTYVPSVGGRNVERCLYCDEVVAEVKVTKNNIRRMQ